MPKQKTKNTVLKRFRITKTGKILRRRQYGRHLRKAKSKSQIGRYKRMTTVGRGFEKMIRTFTAAHG